MSEERYQSYLKLLKESDYHEMSYLEKRRKDRKFGQFIKSALKEQKKTKTDVDPDARSHTPAVSSTIPRQNCLTDIVVSDSISSCTTPPRQCSHSARSSPGTTCSLVLRQYGQ